MSARKTEAANIRAGQADSLETLISAWGQTRRARGGWWALAGFSFQAAIYLQRFFESLEQRPGAGRLATTELLSDILVPGQDVARLIQVKRTLTKATLRSAVREAYDVAAMCKPELLDRIGFGIACLSWERGADPSRLRAEEVIGREVDLVLWSKVLSSLSARGAITEESDPFDNLHDQLWRAGVTDVASFVEECLGILLRAFENPSRNAIEDAARTLERLFRVSGSWRDTPPSILGQRIGLEDVCSARGAEDDTHIAFNRRPGLKDLQQERFRTRPDIFAGLTKDFAAWRHDVELEDDVSRIPIFWIEGRSGEGKSVLLLQLAKHILGSDHPPLVTLLSADDLPAWIEQEKRRQNDAVSPAMRPPIAVIDDLHLVTNGETWDRALRRATAFSMPRVAVLACGPTLERLQFQSRCGTIAEIRPFPVPNLDGKEMADFAEWFATRTHSAKIDLPASVDNRLLVIWLFELVQQESLPEFAQNFRTRLQSLGVFELVNIIVGVNALGLPAPPEILEGLEDDQRDAFDALCSESQLHFEILAGENGGLALAHPQISWILLQEWVRAPTSVAKAWGRTLAKALIAALGRDRDAYAARLLFNAGISNLLPSSAEETVEGKGTMYDMLAEFYAKSTSSLPLTQRARTVVRWLDIVSKNPELDLTPDPIEEAIGFAEGGAGESGLTGYTSGWLWRISDLPGQAARRERLRRAARAILMSRPAGPDVASGLGMIASLGLDRQASFELCRDWLATDTAMQDSGRAIAAIVAAWPQNEAVMARAIEWLRRNPSGADAYSAIASLLAHHRRNKDIKELAIAWVRGQQLANQPSGYYVLEALLASSSGRPEVITLAMEWVNRNPSHPFVRQLLQPLLAKAPLAEGVRSLTEAWIAQAGPSSVGHTLVAALVTAYGDEDAVSLALRWCEDESESDQLYRVLTVLLALRPAPKALIEPTLRWLARYPDHRSAGSLWPAIIKAFPDHALVKRRATDWAQARPGHPELYQPLAPLVKANRNARKPVAIALEWLRRYPRHEEAYWLLATLVAARRRSRRIFRLALDWLDAYPQHRKANHLYMPLVAARAKSRELQRRVRPWLESQQYHPRNASLVATLILRTNGASSWVEYGERYVAHAPAEAGYTVLSALVRATRRNCDFVDRVIGCIEGESEVGLKRRLGRSLGGALAHDVEWGLDFLASERHPRHIRLAAEALAFELRQFDYFREEDVAAIYSRGGPWTGDLLAAMIGSKAPSDPLLPFLRNWLEGNRGADEYHRLLRALKRNPGRWNDLLDSGRLHPGIVEDYDTLSKRDRKG